MKTFFLTCGILSSLLYVLMNIFIPMQFEGYSYSVHTVSELSAIGAPTRQLWVWLAFVYISLFAAFAVGVWKSVDGNRFLRITAILMFVYSIVNFYWPPMHLRGNEPTLTDTLHIVWAMITVLLMMLMMGFGAAALGKRFRLYTVISITAHLVFGILTSLEAPNIPTNEPTPWIGIWERINIAVFMIWIVVLAIALMRRNAVLWAGLRTEKPGLGAS
jgi:hypothetical protein